MLADCHIHTPFCGHAVGEPIEYVRAAAANGVSHLTFTCHIPLDPSLFGGPRVRMASEDLPRYFDAVADAAREGNTLGVTVLTGIEAEIYPEEAVLEPMDRILSDNSFDFVLGSLHHQCAGYQAWIAEQDLQDDYAIVEAYFRHLRDGVLTRRYDSIAHADIIRLYGTIASFAPEFHENSIRAFLESLVQTGTCMEVNTSGLIKPGEMIHPVFPILAWASELGVPLTLGSDAHCPERVGHGFEHAFHLLQSLGYSSTCLFHGRRRQEIPIPVLPKAT